MAESKRKIEYRKIDELVPYVNNPRINENAVPKVASSIKEFGFNVPLVIDKENVIICGHTRYEAAKMLEIKDIPCICVTDLTPAQVKAYRIADNKVADFAKWDNDVLAIEMEALKELDFDLDLTGFEEYELDVLLDPKSEDDFDNFFEDSEPSEKEKKPKQIKCPHCGEMVDIE